MNTAASNLVCLGKALEKGVGEGGDENPPPHPSRAPKERECLGGMIPKRRPLDFRLSLLQGRRGGEGA